MSRKLPVSLEDLYTGAEKKMKVTRKLMDPSGRQVNAEKILAIQVKPGWKAGTKIKFSGEGDETPSGTQDLEFVIEEKAHQVYTRDNGDLKAKIQITLVEALCGFKKQLPFLDGSVLSITNASDARTTQPGSVIYMKGKGMPIAKSPGSKGDLLVTVNVVLPASLSPAQKQEAAKLFG